ncbi:MAG: type II CRISPR RNA-guided endonuclease Cas9 [Melioribacteraceae bacterium]|nr:type II CRISPR RNA-guided endonuclease Cas9 [Melioribacteraceae bacterium]
MKRILGLDIGTTSIGWAFVNEAENDDEKSSIVKLGVRIIPISTDEENDFQKGKSISINADRTLKRGARRNLDRYQIRRDALIKILRESNFIVEKNILNESGKDTTFSTYRNRAIAVHTKISKEDLSKVLFQINKKRGYKSSRKAKSDDEGSAIDGMDVAKQLYENNITPGQYVYELLKKGKKYIPEFYRSDLQNELDKTWEFQKQFYMEILTEKLKEDIKGKNKGATWKICEKPFGIKGINIKGNREEQKIEKYRLRVSGTKEKLKLEQLAIVLQEINALINNSSGYLGEISDRSKELYFNKLTVGEYLFKQLESNPHTRLKNQVFYRQDYLDEFEAIWEKQKEFYPELTDKLKTEIRDVIIFYQRPLKSQKGLLSFCEFESWEEEYFDDKLEKKRKRIIGHRVIPKSSPLFQEFRIWQNLNNVILTDKTTGEIASLEQEVKDHAFEKLYQKGQLSQKDFLKLIVDNPKDFELNFEKVEGNRTNSELFKAYQKILEYEGVEYDFSKMNTNEVIEIVKEKFTQIGISTDILNFYSDVEGNDFDKQPIMQLWHLLYSAIEEDRLIEQLEKKFGFKKEYAKLIASISLQDGYGNLSARAIRKILPYLKEGNTYDEACALANYNHSKSLTKEEVETRELMDKLELLPKNSLRNPIVEKILNQMVNVVNAIIIDENLGKPDEIRVELARDLKKSAKEREEKTKGIREATAAHEKIRKILRTDFGISKVTRNDIIRYKLWKELESNGFKTLYTSTYVPKEELFSKKFDIEHIIPQAKLFDDSFSNKTLSARDINIEKGNETAFDFLIKKLSKEEFENYLSRIERLYKKGNISKAKYNKLKMKNSEIPDGFIDRDLRNSQYIAKKAVQMLSEVVRKVNTTTGSVTNRLREDWQIINVMKEINLPKYEKLDLVEDIEGKQGQIEKRIKDWTKRNDHRHHAMDALTVAFTSYAHIQYLNNMSARGNERHNKYHEVYGIEQKYLYRNDKNKLLFKPPMPLHEFREEAKKHLNSILVSFKAKNKVVTRNKNKIKIKGKEKYKTKIELTPRGQLHKETVYGKITQYETKDEKVGTKFDLEKIKQVANKKYREALLIRLAEFDNNPKKAFGGVNSPGKNPVYIDKEKNIKLPEKVKLVWSELNYTIRKGISPDIKIDKVIDVGVQQILQNRLDEFGGDAKKAFINLDENPIWLNKDKGIAIKRVTIKGVSNAEPIHDKKNHFGELILDKNGEKQPVDFISTGNNHHVAIYRDEDGKLQDEVVSFYQAVWRVKENLPIIDKSKNGWEFLFTMKQNEYFVFPSDEFNPDEIDLENQDNAFLISPYLFRVQTLSKVVYGSNAIRDYVFRHHLDTSSNKDLVLKRTTYIPIKALPDLEGIVKVRINHLGQIVKVGEY